MNILFPKAVSNFTIENGELKIENEKKREPCAVRI